MIPQEHASVRRVRPTTTSAALANFVVDGPAQRRNAQSTAFDDRKECKRLMLSSFDCVIAEFDSRFCERNAALARALDSLDPASKDFHEPELLEPLGRLINVIRDKTELSVARTVVHIL